MIYAKKYAWPFSLTWGPGGLVGPHLPAATPRVPPFGKIRRRGRKASPANEAPIDNHVDARAEGRRLTRQKDGGPNQLINGGHAAERRVSLEFLLFRCFLRLVSELVNVWDSQVELAGSVVGGGSEVDEVLESPSHSLC